MYKLDDHVACAVAGMTGKALLAWCVKNGNPVNTSDMQKLLQLMPTS